MLTLCHWEVAIDEVVLHDPSDMAIDAAESQALLEAARPFFQEDGIVLRRSAAPGRWLARGELFRGAATASLDRAAGGPISAWAPLTDALRPVRKLQNEMQMLLYTQRVNDERIARGLQPINLLLAQRHRRAADSNACTAEAPTVLDALRAPALRDDAAAWAAAWQALDAGPIAELLAAYRRGEAVSSRSAATAARAASRCSRAAPCGWVKSLFTRTQATTVLAAL